MNEGATGGLREAVARVPGVRPLIRQCYLISHSISRRRWERTIKRRDRERLAEMAGRTDLRLNIGSSGNHLPGWISIDIRPDDICLGMDASEPWPFSSGAAEAVNSEHFIEHLTLDEARSYLREAHRVLRPGGLIRTTTPNLEGICRLYLARDQRALEVHRTHGYKAETHGEMLNNYFFSWDHRHIHDMETLGGLLRDAGFTEIAEAAYGRSSHELLAGIDRHDPGDLASTVLCVDAVKPV